MLEKPLLILRGVSFLLSLVIDAIRRSVAFRLKFLQHTMFPSASKQKQPRNIVVVGASIAGYTTASTILRHLMPDSEFRVVVVEPRDHFQFTWVQPRFCVVDGHEHKAFIPYGGMVPRSAIESGKVAWVKDRVESISKDSVRLTSTGQDVPYDYLVVATGAGATDTLPSRVGADDKATGMVHYREMQKKIRESQDLVVVGGGAAGVELATDAKSKYPEKRVSLVHSRDAVMHRFGPMLQNTALDGIKKLGIEVITSDRVISEDKARGVALLKSGKEIACDYLVNCTGQRPNSSLVAKLSPKSVSESGHIYTKPTLQIQDDSLPNVYVCGDVSETNTTHPNFSSASRQATTVAFNVLSAIEGKKPTEKYVPHWFDGHIKLTLGLDKYIVHVGDGKTEMVFPQEEKHVDGMAPGAWKRLGVKPFEDDESIYSSMVKAKI